MTLDAEFVKLLRCLETGSPVALLDQRQVDRLNRAITAGKITNQVGQTVERPLESALVNAERTCVYPVRNGIPVMIAEHAIPYDAAWEEEADRE